MNRRSFFEQLAKAGAGVVAAPMILPAALTYARVWVPERRVVRFIVPQPLRPMWPELFEQYQRMLELADRAYRIPPDFLIGKSIS